MSGSAVSMNIKRIFEEPASKILLDCQSSKGEKRREKKREEKKRRE
jgi:hypothetical protein